MSTFKDVVTHFEWLFSIQKIVLSDLIWFFYFNNFLIKFLINWLKIWNAVSETFWLHCVLCNTFLSSRQLLHKRSLWFLNPIVRISCLVDPLTGSGLNTEFLHRIYFFSKRIRFPRNKYLHFFRKQYFIEKKSNGI